MSEVGRKDAPYGVRYQQPNSANAQWMTAPVFQRNPETRHRLDVQIHVFNEPWQDNNGNGVWDAPEPFIDISAGAAAFGVGGVYGSIWTPQQVDRTISFMRSYLATEGILLNVIGRAQHNPPGTLFTNVMGTMDVLHDNVTNVLPSNDESFLQGVRIGINTDLVTNNDVLEIFFTAPIAPQPVPGGIANPVAWSWGARNVIFFSAPAQGGLPLTFMNQCIIGYQAVTLNLPAVPAHEIMHVLTNTGDGPAPPYIYFPMNQFPNNSGTVWNSHRRLQAVTGNMATNRRPAPVFATGGNHLLRNP